MRTRSEEWEVVLQEYARPQALESRFTVSLAHLLPIAHGNPVFRSLYPVISMWSLTVTDSAVMEVTADALPAIAAMDGVYTVLAWPYPQETVLFQSADPVEAVEFTARLIEKQRAG